MIRVIVNGIQKVCLNPTRNQCAVVTKAIIQKHPDSFQDKTEEGELVLFMQRNKWVENKNRTNMVARHQRKKRTNTKEI